MLRQARYLVKLCKDILKIYTLYEKWNHVSGDKLVASFIWCIVYCKIFRLPHEMPHSWVLHFTSGLSNTFMRSKCYDTKLRLQVHCKYHIRYADTYIIQHTQRYCFASNSNKMLFLSNWTVEFPNFQGQLWQKTISHWIWNFHVQIWRISKWMFCT